MDKKIIIPYGKQNFQIVIPPYVNVDLVLPQKIELGNLITEEVIYKKIIQSKLYEHIISGFKIKPRIGIVVSDKTRPVPNNILLPPLLRVLSECRIEKSDIKIFIASGTHSPMRKDEYIKILPQNIIEAFEIIVHDCDDINNLTEKQNTSRGTPVYINRIFDETDIKIVVGDIEPHHFAGFSGGVKGAAIGLTGRQTINTNHKLLLDDHSTVGLYKENPLRQDIEEIGKIIGIDYALNAILNEKKEIIQVYFGSPLEVMADGVEYSKKLSIISITDRYDFVIASAGGYPKDINFYQSQKALTHASLFCKDSGMVFLCAECSEGVGSDKYLQFVKGLRSHESVIEKFRSSSFEVGPHKAFQVAKIAQRINFKMLSSINDEVLESLMINPIHSLENEILDYINQIGTKSIIALLPYATATIPTIQEGK
ncbi:MAG: nickel-dependent lactate racemase [Candidatus Atribacteria bacterium]|nr:nickel-dependent lactate racemase [Candidatus Atribacteria bacterium]